jgi:DNA-binding CsgD family transcriptional regulator
MTNAWYVEALIKNQFSVWQNVYKENNSGYEPGYELNLYDDDYNNLLLVQEQIKVMLENGVLSDKEILILDSTLSGKTTADIEKEFGISRLTISKTFSDICDRIALILGSEFTNDGYLDYMTTKYNLTPEQIERARDYMISNKKHSLMRGGTD